MDRYFYHDNQEKVEVIDNNKLIDRLLMNNPYYINQSIKPLTVPDLQRLLDVGRITSHGLVRFKLNTQQPNSDHVLKGEVTFKAELKLLPKHYPKMFPDIHLNVNSRLFFNTPDEFRQHHACTALVHYNPRLDGGSFVVPEDVVFNTLRVENVPIAQFMPILLQHPNIDKNEMKTLFQILDIYNRQQDAVNERVGDEMLMPQAQEVVSQADVDSELNESWRDNLHLKYAAENWLAKKEYIKIRPQCFVCGFNAGDPEVKEKMLEKVRHFNQLFYHPEKKEFAYAATDLKENIHIMTNYSKSSMLYSVRKFCLGFEDMLVVEEQPFRDLRIAGCQEATLKCKKEVECRIYNDPLFNNDMMDQLYEYRTDGKYIYPSRTEAPAAKPIYVDRILNVYRNEKVEILSSRAVDRSLEEYYHIKEENRSLMYRPTENGVWFYQNKGKWCAWLDKNRQLHTLGQPPGMKSLNRINEIAASQNIILGGKLVLKPLDDLGTRTFMKPSSGILIDVNLTLCNDGKIHTSWGDRLTNLEGWHDVTGRVTEAKVHQINEHRMTVQCKIDGEIQMAKELNPFYRKLYKAAVSVGTQDEFTRQLAHHSYKDELINGQDEQQSRGFRR